MTRTLEVEWSGGSVTATLAAGGSSPAVLLAPGAGAGQSHRFMVAVRDGLAGRGITVMSFDYAYMEAGRRSPDRMPRLLEVHEAALDTLLTHAESAVLVGKSMGGRVGSHLVGGREDGPGHTDGVAGLVYLGYPLVALGKTEPRPTDHLERIAVPQLFVAGTRDRLGPPELIGPVVDRLPDARLEIIDDADHGFHVPKRTGRTDEEVLAQIAELVAGFVGFAAGQTGGGT